MPYVFEYLLKLSICLGVVYLFYQLLLRRLTFYNWNRWYLLGYGLLSFIIPVIDIMPSLQERAIADNVLVQWIPAFSNAIPREVSFIESITAWDVVLFVFGVVSICFFVKFLVQIISLKRLQRKAVLVSNDSVKIYQVQEDIVPFSFGNAMYVNMNNHTEAELKEIIRHEFVHIKQQHTIDVILVELLCVINWFNPFAWLIKKAVKQNLEFIADRKVVEKGMDKTQYQYLLLKVMGNKEFAFANNFNFTSLKKRIMMMNKNKTAQMHVARFLFLLPVLAVLLLSFRSIAKNVTENEALIVAEDNVLPQALIAADTIPEKKTQTLALQKVVEGKKITSENVNDTTGKMKQPLVVLNGVPQRGNILSALSPEAIESITVLKNDNATALYGAAAINGVLLITTKSLDNGTLNYKVKTLYNGDSIPAITVRGYKISDSLSLKGKVTGFRLNADSTSPVTVRGYKITSRATANDNKEVVVQGYSTKSKPNAAVTFKTEFESMSYTQNDADMGKPMPIPEEAKEAYIVINGNPATKKQLDKLDKTTIKTVEVLKSNYAKKYYGEKAAKGAVVIITK